MRRGILAGGLLLAAPGAAEAACAPVPFAEQVDGAEVVLVGRALDGPRTSSGTLVSPARFAVERVDKGRAGGEVRVDVGEPAEGVSISIGPFPRPGERYRILARVGEDGVLDGNECRGTRRLRGPARAPRLSLLGRRDLLPSRATLAGVSRRPAPRVGARPGTLTVVSTRRLELLRVVRRGRVLATGRSSDGRRWTVRVPRVGARLVADTGTAAWAVALVP